MFKFKSVLNYVYLKFFERFSMRYFEIQSPALDATRLMFKELESDKRTSKIDLGIGIYRDEKGEAPVFKAVKKAETLLLQTEVSKSYKTPAGNSEYCKNILKMVKELVGETYIHVAYLGLLDFSSHHIQFF